jgi:hypothetical protein
MPMPAYTSRRGCFQYPLSPKAALDGDTGAALAVWAASGRPNAVSKARTAMNFFMTHLHSLLFSQAAKAPNGEGPCDTLNMEELVPFNKYLFGRHA